jgi:hypothetical protein
MLVAMGAQERYFAVAPRGSYKAGSAPSLLEQRIGGSPMSPGGALRKAGLSAPPQPGDAVWYGESNALPAEHVEHGKGVETVQAVTRELRWNGSAFIDQATARPIIGIIDCDLLAERLGIA